MDTLSTAIEPRTVLTVFGTRPEVIKLAPVLARLAESAKSFRSIVVSSGQHAELLEPFVKLFGIRADHDLQVMRPGQHLNQLFARTVHGLDPILEATRPDAVLVQGDTTTAAASALAAFQRRIPVGHIEAGLRTGDPHSPFPEEMNRRLITRLARWHFAATRANVLALRREGVATENIFRTGNTVVDSLRSLERQPPGERLAKLLAATAGLRRLTFTMHRRESFGGALEQNLRAARSFIERHPDTALIFPMHPNPIVREKAYSVLTNMDRVHLTEPFDYGDFITLLRHSWRIASDSGGVQEEAPSLGVPLLVLRDSTERPEALQCGAAILAPTAGEFALQLDRAHRHSTEQALHETEPDDGGPPIRVSLTNPFGDGRAAERIVTVLRRALHPRSPRTQEAIG